MVFLRVIPEKKPHMGSYSAPDPLCGSDVPMRPCGSLKAVEQNVEDVASMMMEALGTLIEAGHVRKDMLIFWIIGTGINSWVAHDRVEQHACEMPAPSI
jgi:hypothetical protein